MSIYIQIKAFLLAFFLFSFLPFPFLSCLFLSSLSAPSLSLSVPLFFLAHVGSSWNTVPQLASFTLHYIMVRLFGFERHTFHSRWLVVASKRDVSVKLFWVDGAASISDQMPAAVQPFPCEQAQTAGLELGRGLCLVGQADWPTLAWKACSEAGTSHNRIGKLLYKMDRNGPKGPGSSSSPFPRGLTGLPSLKKQTNIIHRNARNLPTWSKEITDSLPLLFFIYSF